MAAAQCDSNFTEGMMLALRFCTDDYAFVYTGGRPIGAILVGQTKGRSQFSLLFSGRETDFEILRPQAVERRFGRQELEKLRSRFLRFKPKTAGKRAVRVVMP
jgi:hypothetical protein